MSTASRAVFLSYASEDAPAAQRIAEALSAAGIELWFDREELRGGDAWDQKIRQQIRDCRLFVPIISAHSEARLEGYFRREWKLAVDRTDDMASEVAFLVPVVIDDTPNASAHVPEKFRHVQWTRLPGAEIPPAFIERIRRLLSPAQPDAAGETYASANATSVPRPAAGGRAFALRRTAVVLAIPATAAATLGYFGFERLLHSKPAGRAATANSIAVLPLANESGDSKEQYFSDGISEDLITALSQFPGLKVIGRTSAFQFRDSKEDSRSIGAKLGVAHLLEGSVRRSGEVVRVSAELISTEDGSAQWSERYDRPYKDLFALQDEITRAVAGALKTRLLPGENASLQSERPPSGNLEAYNAMLEGKHYLARSTEADTRKAIERFSLATQLDARYALAWSLVSRSWAYLAAVYLDVLPAQEAYAKARAAARTSLTLAPDLAVAHVAQGYLLWNADFDWRGAEAEFRRALELAPGDSDAKAHLGGVLATLGQTEKAVELTGQALAADPLHARWYNWLSNYLLGLGRLEEAKQAARKAIELQPSAVSWYTTLAMIEIQRGNATAALSAAQQEVPGYWQDAALAMARQIGDDHAAAEAALRRLIERDANSAAFQVADVYAIRKDANETFEWLERAWSNRDPGIQYLLYDPFIGHFKGDPRFAAFCRKVGLPTPAEIKDHA
jgi:TolB-like protein/Flp pilus assembly protein TadD